MLYFRVVSSRICYFYCLLLALLLASCGGGSGEKLLITDYRFTKVSSGAEFDARDGACLYSIQNKLFMAGGWSWTSNWPAPTSNDVWMYEENLNSWINLKSNTWGTVNFNGNADWEGRHTFGCLAFRGKMWIIGGDYTSGHYQNDVWNSTDGRVWNRITSGAPFGNRVLFHSFVLNDWMYIFGGQRIDGLVNNYSEAYYCNGYRSQDGLNWERVDPNHDQIGLCPAGVVSGSVVLNGYVYLIGGGFYGFSNFDWIRKKSVYRSRDAVNWELVTLEAPWQGRVYHHVFTYGHRMFLVAGAGTKDENGNDNLSDIWYSIDGKKLATVI